VRGKKRAKHHVMAATEVMPVACQKKQKREPAEKT